MRRFAGKRLVGGRYSIAIVGDRSFRLRGPSCSAASVLCFSRRCRDLAWTTGRIPSGALIFELLVLRDIALSNCVCGSTRIGEELPTEVFAAGQMM